MQQKIKQLKKMLAAEEDFQKIMSYYFDNIGNDPDLGNFSNPLEHHPILPNMIQRAGASLLDKIGTTNSSLEIGMLGMLQLVDTDFYHGFLTIGPYLGGFIYFDDVKAGLMSIGGANGRIWYTRMTAVPFMTPMDQHVN